MYNHSMNIRRGFTLIEISLFLALSGLIFVGLIVGTSNSISQQRYSDATENFTDFLRGIYSKVSDPQGISTGRSESAIYGKLVTFGEEYDLDSNPIPGERTGNYVFVFDVVGDVKGSFSGGTVLENLARLNISPVLDNGGKLTPAGLVEAYSLPWDVKIEKTIKDKVFTGSMLIVRSPSSGTIYAYATDAKIQVNTAVKSSDKNLLKNFLANFTTNPLDDINFCLRMEGNDFSGRRRNVHINRNAHNSSAVEVFDLDSPDNNCNK